MRGGTLGWSSSRITSYTNNQGHCTSQADPVLITEEGVPIMNSPLKDRAINPPLEPIYQTSSVIKSMPESTMLFYKHFVLRAFYPLIGTPLCCSGHPFFANILISLSSTKFLWLCFFEGIGHLRGFIFDWKPMKELLLRGIFEGARELKCFLIMDVPNWVISRVVHMVATVEKARIQIGWLDKVISEICVRRYCSILVGGVE